MQNLISHPDEPCSAFLGGRKVSEGKARDVADDVKQKLSSDELARLLIFSDLTARVVEVDFTGKLPAVPPAPIEETRRPGRPKLGVIGREVTLLPRHWDWLEKQSGGASVALRRLVDEARKLSLQKDEARRAQEVAYRFMSAMAGDRPNFEEAARALFAGDREKFAEQTKLWPEDIRDHAMKLAGPAFPTDVVQPE